MKVTSTVAVPPAVASKFTNPMPYYVWIVIGGIYGPPTGLGGPGANNGPAMSAISYAIWPEDYPTNAPTPKSVQTMLDTVWTEVNNNWSRGTHDADEVGPDSAFVKILGDAAGGGSPSTAGFTGVKGPKGDHCFLDSDGNPCLPKIIAVCVPDAKNQISVIKVAITNAA
jgi:hypothetical protein